MAGNDRPEKRRSPRRAEDGDVELVLEGVTLAGRARNVSGDGMLVEVPEGLQVRVTHQGRVRQGVVVRLQAISATRWSMGIHFQEDRA